MVAIVFCSFNRSSVCVPFNIFCSKAAVIIGAFALISRSLFYYYSPWVFLFIAALSLAFKSAISSSIFFTFLTAPSIYVSMLDASLVFLSNSCLLAWIWFWVSFIWLSIFEIDYFCLLILSLAFFDESSYFWTDSINVPNWIFFWATFWVESLNEFYTSPNCCLKILMLSFRFAIAVFSLALWFYAVITFDWVYLCTAWAFFNYPSKVGMSALAAFVLAVSCSIMSNKLAIALFALSCL